VRNEGVTVLPSYCRNPSNHYKKNQISYDKKSLLITGTEENQTTNQPFEIASSWVYMKSEGDRLGCPLLIVYLNLNTHARQVIFRG
jgi:hypothetical protein